MGCGNSKYPGKDNDMPKPKTQGELDNLYIHRVQGQPLNNKQLRIFDEWWQN